MCTRRYVPLAFAGPAHAAPRCSLRSRKPRPCLRCALQSVVTGCDVPGCAAANGGWAGGGADQRLCRRCRQPAAGLTAPCHRIDFAPWQRAPPPPHHHPRPHPHTPHLQIYRRAQVDTLRHLQQQTEKAVATTVDSKLKLAEESEGRELEVRSMAGSAALGARRVSMVAVVVVVGGWWWWWVGGWWWWVVGARGRARAGMRRNRQALQEPAVRWNGWLACPLRPLRWPAVGARPFTAVCGGSVTLCVCTAAPVAARVLPRWRWRRRGPWATPPCRP
jgi:hypothetical protein